MDNGNLPVQVPDFTRGEWNKTRGYRHATASPADEAATRAAAEAFTKKLKDKGAKYWKTGIKP